MTPGQDVVDRAFPLSRPAGPPELPKGLTEQTLDAVVALLRGADPEADVPLGWMGGRSAAGWTQDHWPRVWAARGLLHCFLPPAAPAVVDGLRDIGVSGGVDGAASTLDLTVRAAAALAEHHVRTGDRVGLLVIAADGTRVPLGAGPRHLHRLHGTLARVRTEARSVPPERLDLGAGSGSVVHVLSPMLFTPLVTATASLQRRGGSVIVVDTLGEAMSGGADRLALPSLAARMQRIERDDRLQRLAGLGTPVVPWRGPGTLDTVLHLLARRAQVPKVRA